MRRMGMVAVAALAGCSTLTQRPGPYEVRGIAEITSFQCARERVSALGYNVVSNDGQSFRAERVSEGTSSRVYGYLSVSIYPDAGGRELFSARAERVVDPRDPRVAPAPGPAGPPVLGPQPPRAPRPVYTRERDRVTPGETAGHARQLVRACTRGEVPGGATA
ncbi:MAG TPA: hypothetical protein VHG91_08730 [Longimicrobium sp.]|nr:hypothetical protein [Longimicrobium sp.]